MPSPRRLIGIAASLLAAGLTPTVAHSQQASVLATASVVSQPLTLRTVASIASGPALQIGIEGCGTGTLTVDGRRADGTLVRVSRRDVSSNGDCGRRDLRLPLVHGDGAQILRFEVQLTQGDALLAPSVAQFVVNAAATRTGSRTALMY